MSTSIETAHAIQQAHIIAPPWYQNRQQRQQLSETLRNTVVFEHFDFAPSAVENGAGDVNTPPPDWKYILKREVVKKVFLYNNESGVRLPERKKCENLLSGGSIKRKT